MSSSLTEDDVSIPPSQMSVTLPFPESDSSIPLRHIPFVKLHSNACAFHSDQSCMPLFVRCVMWRDVAWPGKCSSCGTHHCYEVTNNCGTFPFPRKWRWIHEKFVFYKYPFIAGLITTELICFYTSVAIVILSFVFTRLSFHIAKVFHGDTKLYIQALLQTCNHFSVVFVDCTFIKFWCYQQLCGGFISVFVHLSSSNSKAPLSVSLPIIFVYQLKFNYLFKYLVIFT